MKLNLHLVGSVAVISLALGCGPQEDPSDPGAVGSVSQGGAAVAAAPAEASPQTDPAATAPEAPPAPAFGGETSTEGLPMKDEDGKSMDTLAALQYAAEVYDRLQAMEPVDDDNPAFKPRPPLTDLQQLVQYRIIRAVPAAPAGQKYVYDGQTRKVKLVSQ
jgi:hypothetical protein